MHKLRLLMAVSAVAAGIYGLLLILNPAMLASMYGIQLEPGGQFLARMFGAYFIGFAVLNWFGRKSEPSVALWSIILADFVTDVIATLVALRAQLAGLMNASGWEIVIMSLVFTMAFGYFLVTLPLKKR